MCLIMALSLGVFYPLTKKKLQQMNENKQSAKTEE